MIEPIMTLSLSQSELLQTYRALMSRYFIEDALRQENGLESIPVPPFIERLEELLGTNAANAMRHVEQTEEELWQYAWLTFSDEWAWHRAKQDVLTELGPKASQLLSEEDMTALVERRYEERLDRYVEEIRLPGHESELKTKLAKK
jgi:hypothetical protein